MKALALLVSIVLIVFALSPLGCSGATAGSIYDYHGDTYDGGGGSSSNQTPSGQVDAALCAVQGHASVSGSLSGTSLAAKDAIEAFDPTEAKFTLLITDYANACAAGGLHASSNVVAIEYDHTFLSAGTYDIGKTQGLSISYVRYDSSCRPSATLAAQSGSVTFDRTDDCGSAGSFDLVFGGSHVTASFTASVCVLPNGPSCQ